MAYNDNLKCTGSRIAEDKLMSRVKDNRPIYAQTNWKLLLPHLVSAGLSDRATNDYLLNEIRTDHDKGMYFCLKVLPSRDQVPTPGCIDACVMRRNIWGTSHYCNCQVHLRLSCTIDSLPALYCLYTCTTCIYPTYGS